MLNQLAPRLPQEHGGAADESGTDTDEDGELIKAKAQVAQQQHQQEQLEKKLPTKKRPQSESAALCDIIGSHCIPSKAQCAKFTTNAHCCPKSSLQDVFGKYEHCWAMVPSVNRACA